jgi:NAD(P)-dependent dehydrogenase (short-subunit alcohol dehydrogenase family)
MLARAMMRISSSPVGVSAPVGRGVFRGPTSSSPSVGTRSDDAPKQKLTSFSNQVFGARRRCLHTSLYAMTSADTAPTEVTPQPKHVSLVQGASRGIGFEMVRQLLEMPDAGLPGRPNAANGHVVATCRDPAGSLALTELFKKHPTRLSVVKLDVEKTETIAAAAEFVKNKLGRVDVLCQTAAVLHVKSGSFSMAPETSIARLDEHAMMKAYRVNAMGPTLVAKHFADLLTNGTKLSLAGSEEGGGDGETKNKGKHAIVANLSARVSSLGDNKLGGWHSYRASKSALNQLTVNCAIEFARKKFPVTFILLHPGTVDTALSEPFKKNVPPENLFSAERAASQLLKIIGEKTQEHTGTFVDWADTEVRW